MPQKVKIKREGRVEGKAVHNILLDTRCSRTLVRGDLVPEEKTLEGESMAIQCAHGDTVLYNIAQVTIEINERKIDV